MFPTEFDKKQWAAELGLSIEAFEKRLAKLRRRLGISTPPMLRQKDGSPNSPPESLLWPKIISALLKQQPELRKKKRGRPTLAGAGRSKDYQRYAAVYALRQKKRSEGRLARITDKALIKELFDSRHDLFLNIQSATQSVSNGKRIFEKARAEFNQSIKEMEKLKAEAKRAAAERQFEMQRLEEEQRKFLEQTPPGRLLGSPNGAKNSE